MERAQELAYLFNQYPIVFYSIKKVPEWAKILKISIATDKFQYNPKINELIVMKDFGYNGEV